jgi:hypothetical protein
MAGALPEIVTGEFAPTRLELCPPRSIRVVDWNIDRGLHLDGIIEFLSSSADDLLLLQEADLNARRTHRLNIAVGDCARIADELCVRTGIPGASRGIF